MRSRARRLGDSWLDSFNNNKNRQTKQNARFLWQGKS